MKSDRQIYMDFQRADNTVEELRKIARETRLVAEEQLTGALNRVGASWAGENADLFLQSGERINGNAFVLADNVDKIADAIATIAEETYKKEMEAIRIANE